MFYRRLHRALAGSAYGLEGHSDLNPQLPLFW
jgi:hypothetical protein